MEKKLERGKYFGVWVVCRCIFLFGNFVSFKIFMKLKVVICLLIRVCLIFSESEGDCEVGFGLRFR